ncbi:putative NBD/HSP70 family sugar kinase [Mycolicibacterium sp. BK556]|uniref:ROK family transcriptional regulator n=1 Tax=unclassified Mycolicibacterium TaxID=2636767 RepID=UPI0017F3011A|nr:putative NBD/HSP70 family sugar kinase [Mycolicibacterium sp. BK556]MBB3635552.1 putative NBD/HSP70 family sugar kinase [Mycolicibacterium sp. BK607]MBB3747657.1 putative NBD/HSP70 family sugar kinase [Mycolicibacterium sp. BK634]
MLKPSDSTRQSRQVARLLLRQRVVHLLRTSGPLARADLADKLGLPRPQITTIVADLIEDGTLVELESRIEGVSSRGRPRILLDCNPQARRVLGIQIDGIRARVVLADATGNISHEGQTPTGDRDPTAVIRSITTLAKKLMADAGGKPASVVGICIPGLVDDTTGLVIEAHEPGWANVELGKLISRELGMPVAVQDTTKAITLAETIAGEAREARSAIVLDHGGRLGVGLIIDGRPYTGSTGVAGAIGHVPVYGSTASCRCGRIGCAEADMSMHAMQAAAPQTVGMTYDDVDIDALRQDTARNQQAQDVIRDVIDRVAHTAALIEALLDPELVIVAGLIIEFEELATALQARIDELRPPERQGRTTTVLSNIGRDAPISVIVALQQLDPDIAGMLHSAEA